MSNEPLVLLGNADKWLAESLESVLTQGGYRVMATTKRQQVLELARRYVPDGIVLDMGLDQRASDNLALCRALRRAGRVHRAPGPAARLCGLSTGQWRSQRRGGGSPGAGVAARGPHLRCRGPHRSRGVRGLRARDR